MLVASAQGPSGALGASRSAVVARPLPFVAALGRAEIGTDKGRKCAMSPSAAFWFGRFACSPTYGAKAAWGDPLPSAPPARYGALSNRQLVPAGRSRLLLRSIPNTPLSLSQTPRKGGRGDGRARRHRHAGLCTRPRACVGRALPFPRRAEEAFALSRRVTVPGTHEPSSETETPSPLALRCSLSIMVTGVKPTLGRTRGSRSPCRVPSSVVLPAPSRPRSRTTARRDPLLGSTGPAT